VCIEVEVCIVEADGLITFVFYLILVGITC
jgi:hypothetical protein